MSSHPRRGLLADLDEAAFERQLQAARPYAQGGLPAIEWIRVLPELWAFQHPPALDKPRRAVQLDRSWA
jgi:hypothetical protein